MRRQLVHATRVDVRRYKEKGFSSPCRQNRMRGESQPCTLITGTCIFDFGQVVRGICVDGLAHSLFQKILHSQLILRVSIPSQLYLCKFAIRGQCVCELFQRHGPFRIYRIPQVGTKVPIEQFPSGNEVQGSHSTKYRRKAHIISFVDGCRVAVVKGLNNRGDVGGFILGNRMVEREFELPFLEVCRSLVDSEVMIESKGITIQRNVTRGVVGFR